MVQDLARDSLVLGLTEAELAKRFPDVLPSRSTFTQEQLYYTEAHYSGQEVRWLGDSPWLVRLEHGRVVALYLVKG
jgi:hypothetical protein